MLRRSRHCDALSLGTGGQDSSWGSRRGEAPSDVWLRTSLTLPLRRTHPHGTLLISESQQPRWLAPSKVELTENGTIPACDALTLFVRGMSTVLVSVWASLLYADKERLEAGACGSPDWRSNYRRIHPAEFYVKAPLGLDPVLGRTMESQVL
jgi:hypothetical protein